MTKIEILKKIQTDFMTTLDSGIKCAPKNPTVEELRAYIEKTIVMLQVDLTSLSIIDDFLRLQTIVEIY